MHVKECNICGKTIKSDISLKHVRAQLENHKVTHGKTNRLKMNSGKRGRSEKRKKRVEKIRSLSKKILTGNSFGLSSKKLKKKIFEITKEKYSIGQISGALTYDEEFLAAAQGNCARGSTWILVSELEGG